MTRTRAPAVGTTVRLVVDWLDDHGQGVGETGGRRVAVHGALPGDDVTAEVTWASPTSPWTRARLLHVHKPSPDRRDAPCAHAPRCPGCPLSGLDGAAQLRAKHARVLRALADEGLPHPALPPVHAAPSAWDWRIRAKYVVDTSGAEPVLGAYAPGTHDVWPSHACAAVHPAIRSAVDALRPLLREHGAGPLRYVVARTDGSAVLGTLVVRGRTPWATVLAPAWRRAAPALVGVTEHLQPGSGDAILDRAPGATRLLEGVDHVVMTLSGVAVQVGTEAFTQLHPAAADALVQRAVELAGPLRGARVVDTYGGIGAFTFALARAGAREVLCVDDNAAAVAAGGAAARAAGLAQVRFECADAAGALPRVERADVVVVDPPRKGLSAGALAAITALQPGRVVYVACDPRALGRDGKHLLAHGYALTALEPFDLFPQTPEVETLALFTRAGPEVTS
ncbi:MAG: 23S rRNA (uracil(1939)-C(5))-methyltransferase RlmD [Deltaproteobacteria bacterium]|nr:23S rRNA (uracil(1939)-C(5))-methyltransferase RlmD [Deltaproteobacteria bacterium]